MKPESEAWTQLQAYAAGRLRPGLAERVLREARARQEMPSLRQQFFVSMATAAFCLGVFAVVHMHTVRAANARALADWHEIATDAQYVAQQP